jgi:hypothetical protein
MFIEFVIVSAINNEPILKPVTVDVIEFSFFENLLKTHENLLVTNK